MGTIAIKAEGLTKMFGSFAAVDGLSFSAQKGSLFGLLGPNDSGKTTTIKMLTGQMKPSAGSSSVGGIDPADNPIGVRGLVGIIPEQETPPSFLTAEEYIRFVGKTESYHPGQL